MAWYEKTEEQFSVWQELQTEDGLTYFYNTDTKETSWERPEELMTDEHRSMQGEWVWLPDEEQCFVPGKVTAKTGEHTIVETDWGDVKKIPHKMHLEPLKWSSLQRITPDLVLLDSMSTPLILHNLRKRFESGNIYVIYRLQLGDHKQMPPHVYCIGDNAFKQLSFAGGQNQSVIISGESGAGKTEAAKQVVNYVSSVAGSKSGIETMLFESNPILESFGNAKTVRNNNSSRFGKYMELFFDKELKLCSAFVTNYLLEKIRVPNPMDTERNYHIFYQLCLGDAKYIRDLGLSSPSNFVYLSKGRCTSVDGVDDVADFKETLSAMKKMKFTQEEIDSIFKILAAILHLGNVKINKTGSGVQIEKSENFNKASSFLGVETRELEFKLTTRKMQIRGQQPIDVPLKPHEAMDARDACSKFVYSNLFDWIVKKVNSVMNVNSVNYKKIGILDIFGFEIFKENSFEQMCINYTNEQLQQIFNFTVFKREEQLYKSENIKFEHIPFIDNEPIIKLIEDMPYGILNLLDEECRMPDGSEAKFLNKIADAQKTNKYFKVEAQGGGNRFTLFHYAGAVTYLTDNFIEKNKDTLTQDLLDMVTKSKMSFLASMFSKTEEADDRSRKATLGKQFKNQLRVLIKTLNETDPHYIRCIKPNEDKAALKFISKNCNEQLTYAGVYEAVQIRKAGYPFHMRHAEFAERYGFLISNSVQKNQAGCNQIIAHFNLDLSNIKIGRSMILYRSNEHRLLELKRSIVVEQRDLEAKLQKVLAQNPDNMENPEEYFEELAMMVRKAKRFKMDTAFARQAEQRLEAFIEARIDPETKALVEAAFFSSDYNQLAYAVSVADQFNYQTKMCKDCRKLLRYYTRIIEELDKALDIVDKKSLEVCVNASDMSYYKDEKVERARTLISYETEKFIAEQIRACARRNEFNRQIRLEIALKELIFERSGQMYLVSNFSNLKRADEWAGEKIFGKEKVKATFMSWQKDAIHSTLTNFPADKKYKKMKKDAITMFKNIQIYMGDRKPSKEQRFNKDVAINVLKMCLAGIELRNEFYIQTVKQINKNPQHGSQKKGFDLMILALNTFGPEKNFENHLYFFIYKNSPAHEKERFLIALQTIMLQSKSELKVPTGSEYDDVISGKNLIQPKFTDKSPPGIPSWEDLLLNWDQQEESDDELMFTVTSASAIPSNIPTPKNTTVNKPVEQQEKVGGWGLSNRKSIPAKEEDKQAYNGPWVEYMDAESGYPYYFNEETEETTWDKPDGMP